MNFYSIVVKFWMTVIFLDTLSAKFEKFSLDATKTLTFVIY